MTLPVYFAPMEGVTDAVYRRIHSECFTGVAKYFIPFISPTQNLTLTSRERSNVAPENNVSLYAVPQVLTKNAEHFLWAARILMDLGYREVNLNLGCPSGTVTAKGKGSGMLAHIPEMTLFLDEIFAHSPLPISLKTRIGYASAEEFERILEVYAQYPMLELIIHPRTRQEFYKGAPHRDVYAAAQGKVPFPLVYNGDLFTAQDCHALVQACPDTHALMLGRGMLTNPALARAYAGGAKLSLCELRTFHDRLLDAYSTLYPERLTLGRMREVGKNLLCGFADAKKPRKLIYKANSLSAYQDAIALLFDAYAFCDEPQFIPE